MNEEEVKNINSGSKSEEYEFHDQDDKSIDLEKWFSLQFVPERERNMSIFQFSILVWMDNHYRKNNPDIISVEEWVPRQLERIFYEGDDIYIQSVDGRFWLKAIYRIDKTALGSQRVLENIVQLHVHN